MQMQLMTSKYLDPQVSLPVMADLYFTTVLSLLEDSPKYCKSQQQAVSGISNMAPSTPISFVTLICLKAESRRRTWWSSMSSFV